MWPFWQPQPPATLRYVFNPKEDLTAFELAALIQFMYEYMFGKGAKITASGLSNIPECLHRHFEDRESST